MTRSRNHTTDSKHSLLLIFSLLLSTVAVGQRNQTPDKLLVDARIYTLNARQPWAEALAIKEAKIVAVGSDKQIQALSGSSSKILDAEGHLVLPGFTDCHIHFMDGSLGLDRVDLNGADSVVEMQKRVKAYADAHPDQSWILGMGWAYPIFAPSTLNAAFAAHREKAEGSLEPGKLADLIVLGEDVFQTPASRLSKTEVMLTMIGGKAVYHAPTWARACCSSGVLK